MNKNQDPSLSGEFAEIYQIEKQFKLDNKLKSFEDTFMARVFKSRDSYKIELTSQNNVSFLYKSIIDVHRCYEISQQNGQQIKFKQFFDWTKHIFHDDFVYQFIITGKTSGDLKIYKNDKFKTYLIGTLAFVLASQQQIRESIMFRYQRMKNRKQLLIDYWKKMTTILKTKNPSLLISLESDKKNKKVFR